ncbi:MAG TPA: inositol monophosphatase family protein [Mobilitalea sp.]|nr:inositol monophosphatase family protein [Mobilitalea sp.]
MLEHIKEVVKEAGKIMLNAQHIQSSVESKQGRANFVTKYDVEVQNFLYKELAKYFPTATFIGEEDKQHDETCGDYCFIIDPIDGTTNFIFDYKHSAISVGLMYQEEMLAGVVYNPYLEELFYAEKGKGAFLNGHSLQLTDLKLSEGIVSMGTCPYYREKADETFHLAKKLYNKCLDLRRSGSAALDICYVAAGRTVLYYEMLLSPWDYAAASLILAEAGGRISAIDKSPLTYHRGCSAIAATPSAYEEFFLL